MLIQKGHTVTIVATAVGSNTKRVKADLLSSVVTVGEMRSSLSHDAPGFKFKPFRMLFALRGIISWVSHDVTSGVSSTQ